MYIQKQTLVTILTPVFISGVALASPLISPTTNDIGIGNFKGYVEASGVMTETTIRNPSFPRIFDLFGYPSLQDTELNGDLGGIRLNGGCNLVSGFSIDGFFQFLADGDAESMDLGGVLTYKRELGNGFSGFAGAGYQVKTFDDNYTDRFGDTLVIDMQNNAIIANFGLEYRVQRFVARASYTHGFTTKAESDVVIDLPTSIIVGQEKLAKSDLGTLGFSGAFLITPNTSITAGYAVELLQEATIRDNTTYSLGLQFQF